MSCHFSLRGRNRSTVPWKRITARVGTLALGAIISAGCTSVPGPAGDRPTLSATVSADGPGDVIGPAGVNGVTMSLEAKSAFCCDPLAIDFSAAISQTWAQSRARFEWDFGDERGGTGITLQHTYNWPGTYHVVLSAYFGGDMLLQERRNLQLSLEGGSSTVILSEADPILGEVSDGAFRINAGRDQGAEVGDVVTLTATPIAAATDTLTYSWVQTFGPEVTLTGARSPTARFTVPSLDDQATVTFIFRVTAGDGQRLALDDVRVMVSSGPLAASVAHRPDAGHLNASVLAGDSVNLELTGSDADGDDLTFYIIRRPMHGTLGALDNLARTSATVLYTPKADFTGMDSFQFRATDGELASNWATCTVSVLPPDSEPDSSADPESLIFLSGPAFEALPGVSEVTWRFAQHILSPSEVAMQQDCCECRDVPFITAAPDDSGVYRATVNVPSDRTIWYHVFYTVAGTRYKSQTVYVNPPPGRTPISPPPVIWYHQREVSAEILADVIASGKVTHVMIAGADRTVYAYDDPKVLTLVRMCKQAGIQVIWSRYLWGNWVNFQTQADLYDPEFYAAAVAQTVAESLALGAQYSALDGETYPSSPLDEFLDRDLSPDDFMKVGDAIRLAGQTDQVDFLYPCGTFARPMRVTNLFRPLTRTGIATSTYWDVPQKNCRVTFAYEVFGAYVQPRTDRPFLGTSPFFLPHDILQRRYLWSMADGARDSVNGLFLYPGSGKDDSSIAEVAAMLKNIGPRP